MYLFVCHLSGRLSTGHCKFDQQAGIKYSKILSHKNQKHSCQTSIFTNIYTLKMVFEITLWNVPLFELGLRWEDHCKGHLSDVYRLLHTSSDNRWAGRNPPDKAVGRVLIGSDRPKLSGYLRLEIESVSSLISSKTNRHKFLNHWRN